MPLYVPINSGLLDILCYHKTLPMVVAKISSANYTLWIRFFKSKYPILPKALKNYIQHLCLQWLLGFVERSRHKKDSMTLILALQLIPTPWVIVLYYLLTTRNVSEWLKREMWSHCLVNCVKVIAPITVRVKFWRKKVPKAKCHELITPSV